MHVPANGARRALRFALAVASGAALLSFDGGAGGVARAARRHADDQDDPEAYFERRGYEIELGAHAGYLTAPTADGLNTFGLGLGGRLGVSFSGVYLGASVVDYLGNSQGTLSESSLLVGGELGYGYRIRFPGAGSIVLRPQIGVGYAAISRTDTSVDVVTSASTRSAGKTTTVGNVYVEPRLVFQYVTGGYFVGVSAGAVVVPGLVYDAISGSVTWTSYGARAEVGLRF